MRGSSKACPGGWPGWPHLDVWSQVVAKRSSNKVPTGIPPGSRCLPVVSRVSLLVIGCRDVILARLSPSVQAINASEEVNGNMYLLSTLCDAKTRQTLQGASGRRGGKMTAEVERLGVGAVASVCRIRLDLRTRSGPRSTEPIYGRHLH